MKNTKVLSRWDVVGKCALAKTEFKLKRMRPTDLHLEFLANGCCGSDDHMFHTGAVHSGHCGEHKPLTLGHELIARVKRVGARTSGFKPGDIIAVEPGLPCGECPHCKKERYHCCPNTKYMGTPPQDGGLADEFYWPADWCHKVPDVIADDVELASLAEPLAACLQSVELREKIVVEKDDDEWTVITGTGAMALGVLAVLKALNPNEKVMVIARNKKALEFAKNFGADECLPLSQINPTRIAEAVRSELEELVTTDHFDDNTAKSFKSARSKAGKRAMDAALEAVREARAQGEETPVILGKVYDAAYKAASKLLVEENTKVFKQAQGIAGGYINSVFECTGDEKLLVTLMNSRCMLANGAIIGLGCHYGVSFDIAMLRRFELAFQPVRRSCHKFPKTLELLAEKPDYFRTLVGGTVKFDEFEGFMHGDKPRAETGSGGPKTVVIK